MMAEIDTLFLTKTVKTQPFGAAHIYITHVRESPPPPPRGRGGDKLKQKKDKERNTKPGGGSFTTGGGRGVFFKLKLGGRGVL